MAKKKSEIAEARSWLDWRNNGIDETKFDKELYAERRAFLNELTCEKRMTKFQKKKLAWLKEMS